MGICLDHNLLVHPNLEFALGRIVLGSGPGRIVLDLEVQIALVLGRIAHDHDLALAIGLDLEVEFVQFDFGRFVHEYQLGFGF